MMNILDPDVLDLCSVTWTSVAYVVADLEEPLPKSGDYPSHASSSPPLRMEKLHLGFLVMLVFTFMP